MFWNKYPYTNFHELNLDWILARMMDLNKEWDEFTAVNKITNAGAWDITKQYQAWTVVSDNNIGYISLQPVPAGVAITNTEYWGVIADYNILITDLSNRISTLEGQMSTLNNTTIPSINAAITNIRSHLRNVIAIGDSYGDKTAMGFDTWPEYLEDYLPNSNVTIYGNNGGGFTVAGVGTGKTFNQLLNDYPGDKNAITDIVCIGGSNDRNSTDSDVLDAIEDFCDIAKTDFPNAKVYIGFCGNTNVALDVADHLKFLHTEDLYRSCTDFGACFMNGLNNIMHDYSNFGVTAHPNSGAEEIIGRNVTNILQGGSVDYENQEDVSFTFKNGFSHGYTTYHLKMTATIKNDVTQLQFYSTNLPTCILSASSFALTQGDYFQIAELDSDSIFRGCGIDGSGSIPDIRPYFRLPVRFRATSSGTLSDYYTGLLECYNGILRMINYDMTPRTISDLRIEFNQPITIPTRFN